MNEETRISSLEERLDYRQVLDEVAAVAITDPSGKFTDVNRGFCAMTGYARAELIGQNPRILNSGYHSREFFHGLWETISSGKTWRGEIRNRGRDGKIYWSATTIVPFCDRSGRPYEYVSIRTDISRLVEARKEHVQLEEAQRKLNRAEEAVMTRDRFLSMASHELKTPLTSLQLRLAFQTKKLAASPEGLSRSEQEKTLDFAMGGVRRLASMIDDMLDVSKIAAGRLQFRIERLNLARLVDEVLNRYRLDFERDGVPVEVKGPEQIWGHWDKVRIEQVVINLLTNALKYGEKKPIRVEVGRKGAFATIRVQDRGRGMSEEFQAQLFTRFSRETEGEIPGSGLGLWITSKIVQGHEGRISVESRIGEGSTFTVELPIASEAPPGCPV